MVAYVFFKSFLLDLNYHLDSASHSRYFLPFRTFVTLCRPDHSQNHLRKSIRRCFVIHMFALNNNTANLAKMAKFPFRWLGWLTQVLQIYKNQKKLSQKKQKLSQPGQTTQVLQNSKKNVKQKATTLTRWLGWPTQVLRTDSSLERNLK